MSLLMDALKKAEKDKQEAAKNLKEAEEKKSNDMELSGDRSVEQARPPDTPDDQNSKAKQDASTPDSTKQNTTSTDLSLEPVPLDENNVAKDDASDLSGVDEENAGVTSGDQTFVTAKLSLEDSGPPDKDISQIVLEEEFSDTISDTIDGGRSVRTLVSAAELAQDIGGGAGHPTPVAAQTVFTAVGTTESSPAYSWGVFITLCVVIAISFSTFYYLYSVKPLTSNPLSPLVAKGIEIDPSSLPVIEIPQEILTGGIIGGFVTDEGISAVDVAQTKPDKLPGEQQTQGITTTSELATGSMPGVTDAEGDSSMQQAFEKSVSLPEKIKVEPALIQISRSHDVDKKDEKINSAYKDFFAGNLSEAGIGYKKVLLEHPENRDALLGLAAIAYKRNNLQVAFERYLKVLEFYPKDSVAQAALINIRGNRDPVRSESIVKLLLREQSEAPFLYFTLGHLYAVQSRWADAQQAFFDAYRLEAENPDYAFNLAVSLDHTGQAQTALDYYNVALQLADDSNSNFNTASARARIDALSGLTHPN